jgi:hypothetical protein
VSAAAAARKVLAFIAPGRARALSRMAESDQQRREILDRVETGQIDTLEASGRDSLSRPHRDGLKWLHRDPSRPTHALAHEGQPIDHLTALTSGEEPV